MHAERVIHCGKRVSADGIEAECCIAQCGMRLHRVIRGESAEPRLASRPLASLPRVWERASVVCHQDGTERLGQDRLRCGCPLAWRTNQKDVHVRSLGDPDDFGGWDSRLDKHVQCRTRSVLQEGSPPTTGSESRTETELVRSSRTRTSRVHVSPMRARALA